MKKRNLFLCNSTYQLLVCINIALEVTAKDQNDIVLSDCTDFRKIGKKLESENIFDNIFFIDPMAKQKWMKQKGWGTFRQRGYRLTGYINPEHWIGREYKLHLQAYDSIYASNLAQHFWCIIYGDLARKNRNLSLYEYEEGFGSYVIMQRFKKRERPVKNAICKLFGTPNLTEDKIKGIYLYFPELYVQPDPVPKLRLPVMNLNDSGIQTMLQRIFGCEGIHLSKRYIILEESFKVSGEVNNSEQLFTEVVDIVGTDNVLLKTHPRNGKNSYHERDIAVYDATVAWEALIATENIDDKVLITCMSSSAINAKLLYGSKCKIIFLYKLLEGEVSLMYKSENTYKYIDRFLKKYDGEAFAPSTHEELHNLLRTLN